MSQITAAKAAKILGISKRTLFRWEQKGIISSQDGILKIKIYDKPYIETIKIILDLNKKVKEHLAKLPKIQKNIKKHPFEQDYKPNKPLKLILQPEINAAIKAFKKEEEWIIKYKKLLDKRNFYYKKYNKIK